MTLRSRDRVIPILGLLALALVRSAAGADEIAPLRRNLVRHFSEDAASASSIRKHMQALRPDGTWPDVDYRSQQRSSWHTAAHLYRVRAMAQAYAARGHALAGDRALRDAIVRALGHWLEKDYRNPNWWWNRIGVPKEVDRILLLMGDAVPKPLFDKAVNGILARPGIGMTGQNKVWVAGITLNRGVLLGDAALVRKARDAIVSEVRVTTQEGIQPDASYHQHGPQQQFGNYGLSYIGDQIRWASILDGTAFALDAERREILRRYLLEGLAWVTWRGTLDISACGRQIGPGSPASKGHSVLRAFRAMQGVDGARAADYERLLASHGNAGDNAPHGHRHFWRSDMAVYRQRGFYVSVKMSSRRVIGTETCNSENLQGYYLGDGAAYAYRDGREYGDIFPVWNWRRLPGVTAPQGSRPLVPNRKTQNREAFVGGVSDGAAGIAAMAYARDGLRARKSWFFCGPHVTCLGAGISSRAAEPVLTGVEQRLLDGPVTVSTGGPPRTARGESRLEGVRWVHHGGAGYVFPEAAALSVFAGPRKGSWRRIASKYPSSAVSSDVFELCVDHGTAPADAVYAWILMPLAKLADMQSSDRLPKVLSNRPALQAVRSADGRLVQAIFYEAGRLALAGGRSVDVDAPCVLMLRDAATGCTVSVADPAQATEAVTVTLSGRYRGGETAYDAGRDATSIPVVLPRDGLAGSTVTMALSR